MLSRSVNLKQAKVDPLHALQGFGILDFWVKDLGFGFQGLCGVLGLVLGIGDYRGPEDRRAVFRAASRRFSVRS